MQKLMKVLEDMMIAITFAEAGEFDLAKKLSMQEREDDALASTKLKANEA